MAVSFSSLSRGSRNPQIKYSDEQDNPANAFDVATGNPLLPTWNMPQIPTNFNAPATTPASGGGLDFSGLPSWSLPNVVLPQSTQTTTPAVDNPYAAAEAGGLFTTGAGRTVDPIYPFEEWFGSEVAKEIGYVDKNIWNSMTDEEQKLWAERAWAKYIAGQQQGQVPSTGGGGGGVSGAYADALRDYVASLGSSGMDYQALIDAATARYGGYGDTLTADVAAATAKQQAAAEQARQALAGLMPTTVSNITPADIGAGTASNYLRSIGASTGEVDALRAMEQQMLANSLAGTQAYSQRVAAVEEANRLAEQAAVETILQAASSGLATTEADRRTQYSEALAAEVERLQAAQQAQQADLANRLLEARLMAAQSGVRL